MASLTERYNNPWALKAPSEEWARETYEGVLGLDPQGFIIFANADSGRKAMDQEHRVEKGKGVTVGQHLGTHVGAEADSAGHADALINVPAIASQLSNQPVNLESYLADIDDVVYKKAVARSEGMGPDGLQTFFPEQDSTGVNDNTVTPNFLQLDRNYGQGSDDREVKMWGKPNTASPDSLLPELLAGSDGGPKLQSRSAVLDSLSKIPISDTVDDPFIPAEELEKMSLAERLQYRKDRLRAGGAGADLQDTITGLTDEELKAFDYVQNYGGRMFERFPKMSIKPTPTRLKVPVGEGPVPDDSIPTPDNTGLDLNLDEFAPSAKVSRPSTARTTSPATTGRDSIGGTRLLPTILQALGVAGQSYLQNRAIKEANERTRGNQARSNLINALARGNRAGVMKETPSTGLGTALFKSLSELGAGHERSRSKALEEQQRQSQIDINRERLGQSRASAAATEEDRLYRRDRDRKLDVEKQDEKSYRRRRDEDEDQRLLDEKERLRKKNELTAMQNEGTSLANLFEQIGASGDVATFEELIQAEPKLAEIFNSLDRANQTAVMSQFQKGLNASTKTTESAEAKRLKDEQKIARTALVNTASTAGESGGYSDIDELLASEPSFKKIFDNMSEVEQTNVKMNFKIGKMQAGEDAAPDHSELVNNVSVVKANWDAMSDSDRTSTPAAYFLEDRSVDEQGKATEPYYPIRKYFESQHTYTSVRNALALSIASAFNRGRPTDKDYEITLKLFPRINETRNTADAKWQAIKQLLSLKKQAQDAGWRQDDNKDFLSTGVIVDVDGDKPRIDFEAARRYFNATGRTAPVVNTTTGKTPTQNSGGLTLDLGAKE